MKILAHRGGSHEAPYQNSTEAFTHALAVCDGFETDTIKSRDGDVFLAHDTVFIEKVEYELSRHLDDASKTILGDRRIDQLSTQEAEKLILQTVGSPLPKLAAILQYAASFPEAILNLELKGEDTAKDVIKTVDAAVKAGFISYKQVVISSFNHAQLLQTRNINPDIPIGVLFAAHFQPTGNKLYPWSTRDDNCYIPFDMAIVKNDLIRDINPEFFNLENTDMTPQNAVEILALFPEARGMLWWLPNREIHPQDNTELWQKIKQPPLTKFLHTIISDYPEAMKKHYQQHLNAQG